MKRTVLKGPVLILAAAILAAGCGAEAPAATVTTPPTTAPPAQAESTQPSQPAAADPSTLVFRIVPSESQARFIIDEILRGSPNTVIGVTEQVSGEILVQPADPGLSTLGPIQIDAATLATDSGMRDGAIDNFILQTGRFPSITFTPTGLAGLPPAAQPGDSLSFTVGGDLTIRDITSPVTFDVSLTVESAGRLAGTARATVLRSDFGLTIPSVPSVADVSDEVILEFDFVAESV